MLPVEIERRARELRKKIAEAKPEYAPIKGTTYYVSADGDDNNDGLSPETAWKTLDGPDNNFDNIKSGDAILFRCGDIFSATYPRPYGLKMTPGVTYSSFGEGPKPELRGIVGNGVEFDWKEESENLYSLDLGHTLDVGNIFFDDAKEWGYKLVKGLDNDTTPKMDLEFYHDIAEKKLYLYSEKGSPKERWSNMHIGHRCNIFGRARPGCVVDNLAFRFCGCYGIQGGSVHYPDDDYCIYYGFSGFTVANCEFEWIGGSLLGDVTKSTVRGGNGFEIFGGASNLDVHNCYFNQIYDAALTQQWYGRMSEKNKLPVSIEDCVFSGNLFENNTYDYEYFLTEYETMEAPRPKKADSKFCIRNVYFENNICRKNGYGFGNQRPDRYTPASLKSWTHQNKSDNFIVRNNIFDRGDYRLLEIIACEDKYVPTLINNTYCQYLGKGLIYSQGETSMLTPEVSRTKKIFNGEENADLSVARW